MPLLYDVIRIDVKLLPFTAYRGIATTFRVNIFYDNGRVESTHPDQDETGEHQEVLMAQAAVLTGGQECTTTFAGEYDSLYIRREACSEDQWLEPVVLTLYPQQQLNAYCEAYVAIDWLDWDTYTGVGVEVTCYSPTASKSYFVSGPSYLHNCAVYVLPFDTAGSDDGCFWSSFVRTIEPTCGQVTGDPAYLCADTYNTLNGHYLMTWSDKPYVPSYLEDYITNYEALPTIATLEENEYCNTWILFGDRHSAERFTLSLSGAGVHIDDGVVWNISHGSHVITTSNISATALNEDYTLPPNTPGVFIMGNSVVVSAGGSSPFIGVVTITASWGGNTHGPMTVVFIHYIGT